ncbi:MAG: hypothetical protein HWE16_06845 [Gammaproteobacteria bacterium]|nr:hypothetical protein [Gammaproteobacteria bacterium]
MKKVLIGLLALSVAGNTYFLLKPKEIAIKEIQPEKVVVTETKTITLDDGVLQEQIRLLTNKLSKAEAEILRLQTEVDLHEERIALKKLNNDIQKETQESLSSDVVKLTDEQMKRHEEKRKAIIALYSKESVDGVWAYQAQDEIRQALNDLGDSDSYSFDELSCKTTVCRLKLNPYKEGQAAKNMAIMNATMALVMQPNLDLQMSGAEHLKDEDDGVLIYISKKQP